MDLNQVKTTPDYLLKNITAELTDNELLKELGNTGIPPDKLNAFNLKAAEELKNITGGDKGAATANNMNNIMSGDRVQFGNGQNKVNLGNMVDAELATKMIDTLVPALFVLILKMGVGVSVKKKDLQASQRELETMHPLVQKCLEVIEFNINSPFVALGIVMGVIYTSKAAEIGVDKVFTPERARNDDSEPSEKKPRKPRSDAGKKRV